MLEPIRRGDGLGAGMTTPPNGRRIRAGDAIIAAVVAFLVALLVHLGLVTLLAVGPGVDLRANDSTWVLGWVDLAVLFISGIATYRWFGVRKRS